MPSAFASFASFPLSLLSMLFLLLFCAILRSILNVAFEILPSNVVLVFGEMLLAPEFCLEVFYCPLLGPVPALLLFSSIVSILPSPVPGVFFPDEIFCCLSLPFQAHRSDLVHVLGIWHALDARKFLL